MACPQTLAFATLAAPQISGSGASASGEICREHNMASGPYFYIWHSVPPFLEHLIRGGTRADSPVRGVGIKEQYMGT
jgi:hypothetical protein